MDTQSFDAREGSPLLLELARVVQDNRQNLSDIDGAIGDGDHGVNMAKGFGLAARDLEKAPMDLSRGLLQISRILLGSIGGAMGPLYGTLFRGMSKACVGAERVDAVSFGTMLRGALAAVRTVSEAKAGDKTMMDALVPAVEAYGGALDSGADFKTALDAMTQAAKRGRDATRDMVARVGRASRLGERSRGTPDAGATSCALILGTLAQSIARRLEGAI